MTWVILVFGKTLYQMQLMQIFFGKGFLGGILIENNVKIFNVLKFLSIIMKRDIFSELLRLFNCFTEK